MNEPVLQLDPERGLEKAAQFVNELNRFARQHGFWFVTGTKVELNERIEISLRLVHEPELSCDNPDYR